MYIIIIIIYNNMQCCITCIVCRTKNLQFSPGLDRAEMSWLYYFRRYYYTGREFGRRQRRISDLPPPRSRLRMYRNPLSSASDFARGPRRLRREQIHPSKSSTVFIILLLRVHRRRWWRREPPHFFHIHYSLSDGVNGLNDSQVRGASKISRKVTVA